MNVFKMVGTIALNGGDKANEQLKEFDSGGKKSALSFKNIGKAVAGAGVALVALGASLGAISKKVIALTDSIDKQSQRLGMSRKAYQEWDFILSQNGASINTLQMGMKTLAQKMDEAMEGVGLGADLFKRLGVEIDESMNQEDAFETVIIALQGVENEVERSSIATQLLGRSGQELLPLLNQEAGSIDKLRESAQELGLILGDDTVDAGVKLTDALDKMKRGITNLVANAMTPVIKVIKIMTDKGIEFFQKIQPQVNGFMQTVANMMPKISAVATFIIDVVGILLKYLKLTISDTLSYLQTILNPFIDWLKEFWETNGAELLIIVENTWSLIETAFSVVLENIKSVFSVFGMAFQGDWEGVWEEIKIVFSRIWDTIPIIVEDAFNIITGLLNIAGDTVSEIIKNMFGDDAEEIFNLFLNSVISLFTVFKDSFLLILDAISLAVDGEWTGVWETAKEVFTTLWEGISKVFTDVVDELKTKLINFWNEADTWVLAVTGALATIGGAFIIYKGILLATQTAQLLVNTATALGNALMSANPVGLVVIAVALLVAGLIVLIKNWDDVKAKLEEVWIKVKTFATNVIDKFKSIKDDVVKYMSDMVTNVVTKIVMFKTFIISKFKSIKDDVVKYMSDMVTNVIDKFKSIKDDSIKYMSDMVTNVATKITMFKTFIISKFKSIKDDSIKYIKKLVDDISLWFGDTKLGKAFAWVGEKTKQVSGFFKDMWDKVTRHSYVPDMVDEIGDAFTKLQAGMVDPAKDATEEVADSFEEMADTSISAMEKVEKKGLSFGSFFKNMLSGIGGAIAGSSSEISGAITGFQSGKGEDTTDEDGNTVEGEMDLGMGVAGMVLSLLQSSEQFTSFMEKLQPIIDQVVNVFGLLLEPLLPIVDILANSLSPLFDALGPIMTSVGGIIATLFGMLIQLIPPLVSTLTPVLKLVTWILKDIIMPVLELIYKGLAFLYNGIASVLNGIVSAINKIPFVNIKWSMPKMSGEMGDYGGTVESSASPTSNTTETSSGGSKISEITGPTRDLFTNLLSPLASLSSLTSIGNRIYDLLDSRLKSTVSIGNITINGDSAMNVETLADQLEEILGERMAFASGGNV